MASTPTWSPTVLGPPHALPNDVFQPKPSDKDAFEPFMERLVEALEGSSGARRLFVAGDAGRYVRGELQQYEASAVWRRWANRLFDGFLERRLVPFVARGWLCLENDRVRVRVRGRDDDDLQQHRTYVFVVGEAIVAYEGTVLMPAFHPFFGLVLVKQATSEAGNVAIRREADVFARAGECASIPGLLWAARSRTGMDTLVLECPDDLVDFRTLRGMLGSRPLVHEQEEEEKLPFVRCLRDVHSLHLVHRDLHLDCFLQRTDQSLLLVELSRACEVGSTETTCSSAGLRFAPHDVQLSKPAKFRDDFEALCFMLCYVDLARMRREAEFEHLRPCRKVTQPEPSGMGNASLLALLKQAGLEPKLPDPSECSCFETMLDKHVGTFAFHRQYQVDEQLYGS